MLRGVTVGALLATGVAAPVAAQRSLAPLAPRGLSVTPVYEGWYRLADGRYALSFGYFNRNSEERLEIAVGDSNVVSPGAPNQGQPTHFAPRRHWGVFTVTVPATFDPKAKVTWTLTSRGQTVAIPGSLHPDWQIDAIEGEASTNNTPPALRWSAAGPEGRGPAGVRGGPVDARVGVPTPLTVMATDDGATRNAVDLSWFAHQGPGPVTFSAPTSRLTPTGGTGTTTATFSAPGTYLVRVRAGDTAASTAGHAQCCWTNAFLTVRVAP